MHRPTGDLPAENPVCGDRTGRVRIPVVAAVVPVALTVVPYAALAAAGVAPWRALPALGAALAAYALLWSLRLRRSGQAPVATTDSGPTTPGSS